jgi:signal transduction histidine kinase
MATSYDESCLVELTNGPRVGVVLLDSSTQLKFSNVTAGELLGCMGQDELKERWPEFMSRLNLPQEHLAKGVKTLRFKADFPTHEGSRKLEMEMHGLGQEEQEGHLLLFRDRQSMDNLECELLRASQMRAQPYLLSTLIHALADPLNAIEITLELLKTIPEDGVTPRGGNGSGNRWQQCITALDKELANFRHGVQTFREQGARWDSNFEDMDLCSVTEEIIGLLQHHAQVRHIQARLSLPKTAVMVKGRREHIKQALLNIMVNGMETVGDGGRLLVEISDASGQAEVMLQDNGPGLPAQILDDIDQIHAVMTKSIQGLHLYLARRVAEAHGGEMLVENLPAKGTCFRLQFPPLQSTPAEPLAR